MSGMRLVVQYLALENIAAGHDLRPTASVDLLVIFQPGFRRVQRGAPLWREGARCGPGGGLVIVNVIILYCCVVPLDFSASCIRIVELFITLLIG